MKDGDVKAAARALAPRVREIVASALPPDQRNLPTANADPN
jgi:hypothetical protein